MKLTTAPRKSQWKGRPCYQFDLSVGCHGSNGRRAALTEPHGLNQGKEERYDIA